MGIAIQVRGASRIYVVPTLKALPCHVPFGLSAMILRPFVLAWRWVASWALQSSTS